MILDGKQLPNVKQLLERYIALCGMHAQNMGESEVPWKTLNDQLSSEKNRSVMERLQEGGMGDIVYSMLTKTPDRFMIDVGKKIGGKMSVSSADQKMSPPAIRQGAAQQDAEPQLGEEKRHEKQVEASSYSDSSDELESSMDEESIVGSL